MPLALGPAPAEQQALDPALQRQAEASPRHGVSRLWVAAPAPTKGFTDVMRRLHQLSPTLVLMGPSNPALTVLLVAGSAFVGLVVGTALVGTLPLEAEVRDALLRWAGPSVNPFLHVANHFGDWRLLLPAGLVLVAMVPRARARWWVWVAVAVLTPLVVSLTKDLVGRARPEAFSLGFPSGHATAAALSFGTVCYMASMLPSRPARIAVRVTAVLIVIMVALTRVLLRAHWPSDVLGGVALGLALASAAALAPQVPRPRTTEELQRVNVKR